MIEKVVDWIIYIYISVACYGAGRQGDWLGVFALVAFALLLRFINSWVEEELSNE